MSLGLWVFVWRLELGICFETSAVSVSRSGNLERKAAFRFEPRCYR